MTREFKKVEKTQDAYIAKFWDGEQFFQNDNYGIIDSLNLCKLLNLKYINQAKDVVGDFCLVKG